MCFFVHEDHPTVKIATKNIVCYKSMYLKKKGLGYHYLGKHLTRYNFKNYGFRTPYQDVEIDFEKPLVKSKLKVVMRAGSNTKIIELGLHSYSNLPSARDEYGNIVIKCIIPKGSKYYFNPEDCEYVSNQLLYTKKFDPKYGVIINDEKLLIK